MLRDTVVAQIGLSEMLGALDEDDTFIPPPSVPLLLMVAVVVVMVESGPTDSKAEDEVERGRGEMPSPLLISAPLLDTSEHKRTRNSLNNLIIMLAMSTLSVLFIRMKKSSDPG